MANVDIALKELYKEILEKGELRSTRTGNVRSLWDRRVSLNIAEEFPAVTSKRLAWKVTVGEALFFCNGVPDRRVLQEYIYGDYDSERWDIWKQDCERSASQNPLKFNGLNLGDMYPVMWRQLYNPSWEKVAIQRRADIDSEYQKEKFDVQEPEESSDPLVGKTFPSKKSGDFRVLKKVKNEWGRYQVQFLATGYIPKTYPGTTAIKNGNVKDIFYPTIAGVGYLGEPKAGNPREYLLWAAMIKRCYDANEPDYKRYGGKGVTVSPRWHNYSNFVKDLRSLPNFTQWVNDPHSWCLDKDYYSGRVYSRNTCIFIPKSINSKLTGQMVEKDGFLYTSISDFEKSLGIPAKGKRKNVLKNGGEFVKDVGDCLTRPRLFTDQLQGLLDGLKNKPYSRDHILMNWNPAWRQNCVLPACHLYAQFYVSNSGKLNCKFYMRSSDAFLGLPVNIASYALLTHLIAKWVDLEVGVLTCELGDVHIYENHREAVNEFLGNPEFRGPTFQNPKGSETLESTLKLSAKDFKDALVNYESMGSIKAPLSVGDASSQEEGNQSQ